MIQVLAILPIKNILIKSVSTPSKSKILPTGAVHHSYWFLLWPCPLFTSPNTPHHGPNSSPFNNHFSTSCWSSSRLLFWSIATQKNWLRLFLAFPTWLNWICLSAFQLNPSSTSPTLSPPFNPFRPLFGSTPERTQWTHLHAHLEC